MTSSFFSDLLNSPTDQNLKDTERSQNHVLSDQNRLGLPPKFKSTPPPSLPLSPTPLFSPSSYFSIPPGFSLSELLDSPVLLNSSHILPSPTTGSFANNQGFNWKNNYEEKQENVKAEEETISSSFSFQAQPAGFQSSNAIVQNGWSMVKAENSSSMQSFTPESNSTSEQNNYNKSGSQSNYNNYQSQPQVQILSRRSDDGYNWRKYGQKQVKGSENPRSYYKCTYPNCPTKKKVERGLDGQITEIVYKGSHNHPKPVANKRNTNSMSSSSLSHANPPPSNHFGNEIQMDLVATPENSSISIGDDEFEQTSHKSGGDHDQYCEDEPDAKKWRIEGENEGISLGVGNRTVREPRVVVQTTSDIDILDDGYRWRKYGQKVVKGNPNPRSYYKCTNPGCPVRKHVERASQDLRAVITTYEGKHTHDVPAPRGSGNHSINKPLPIQTTMNNTNNSINNTSVNNGFFNHEMMQNNGFTVDSYMNMNQQRVNNIIRGRAKEEPVEDDSFFESFLS
ncbi:putative transcription factor WRKY family [Medicago truncatula]|nr:WRKY transcription factor WRKY24 [Medicago truncatula]XP_039687249.1 WRKY transcription factor WRKY24 [Medicago truncatula]AES69538.1 WRKY transcription factor [Medicago truncatula]RHN67786.1 putative transcription factor WRKY family [Medicago truncatula]